MGRPFPYGSGGLFRIRPFAALRSAHLLPTAAKYTFVLIPTLFTAAASLLVSFRRGGLPEKEASYYVHGLDLLVLSQLLLLPSTSTYDLYSFWAHLLKVGAYLYLFASLVTATVIRPYQKLQEVTNKCIISLTEAIDAHDPFN